MWGETMRTVTFIGVDEKEHSLFIERNKLNNNIMFWFDHNPTMFYKGINQVLKQLKNQTIISDIGGV